MRRNITRRRRPLRQRISRFHPFDLGLRRPAEEAFELAAELRGAFVADVERCCRGAHGVAQHEQSRLVHGSTPFIAAKRCRDSKQLKSPSSYIKHGKRCLVALELGGL